MSLSARRAWIEIQNDGPSFSVHEVALRKESVDRNRFRRLCAVQLQQSLSARRAWIEITFSLPLVLILLSLSARRAWIEILFRGCYTWIDGCRSPQGERG